RVHCFNSTLVRFKLPSPTRHCTTLPSFQFHFGSIQTCRITAIYQRLEQVSIPLWFDSNALKNAQNMRREALSLFY
ncbi:MAG: hypothetical protein KF749_18020, partial [Bacteroidetes bacterium]|nr:hypothetical protein [Bacteroidota bacterium]